MSNHSPLRKPLTLLLGLLLAPVAMQAQQADQDTTVVVPETGVLAVKPSRNFTTTSKDITVCSFFDSKSSGLYFTKYELDTVIVGSSSNGNSGVFLVAKPGTYTLMLTDREVTGKFNTTSVSWLHDSGTAYKKLRRLYKFVNEPGHVGFVRDEKYASDNYQYCDLAEGEHVYAPLAENNADAIAKLLGTTLDNLQFIPWDGPWKNVPELDVTPAGISSASVVKPELQGAAYNLKGVRTTNTRKGVQVVDGRKVIVR